MTDTETAGTKVGRVRTEREKAERRALLIETAAKNLTLAEAAEHLGMPLPTIRQHATMLGVEFVSAASKRAARVVALRTAHPDMSTADLAASVGVDQRTIYRYLSDAGLTMPKLVPVDHERVATLRREQTTLVRIAVELGVSESRVRNSLRAAGLSEVGSCATTKGIDLDDVVTMWNDGVPMREIAMVLDVNASTIRYHLETAEHRGLLTRPRPRPAPRRVYPDTYLFVVAMRKAHPGRTSAELAERLGVGEGAVRAHLRKARLRGDLPPGRQRAAPSSNGVFKRAA